MDSHLQSPPSVPATIYPAEKYRRLALRAAFMFGISLVVFVLMGVCAQYVPSTPELVLQIGIGLSLLAMLSSLVAGLVSAFRWLRKRDVEPPALPHQRPSQHQPAFWLLLAFVGIGLIAAPFDQQLLSIYGLQGFARAYGPFSAVLGAFTSLLLAIRGKSPRFLLLTLLSLGSLSYWILLMRQS